MALYARANTLFNQDEPTDVTDQQALNLYQELIDKLEKDKPGPHAEILFDAYIKKAILFELKPDYTSSRLAYLKAVEINDTNKNINDSLSFQLFTCLGSAYYRLNNFDSAKYFLQRAEKLLKSSTAGNDKARLFNTFGVLYYDNGNYRQSKTYFNQALDIIKKQYPVDNASAVNIQTNIATADYKLGNYNASLQLNTAILKYKTGTDYISMNLGRTNTALHRYREALSSFRKVNAAKIPGVYNELGFAHLQLAAFDSASWYFDKTMRMAAIPGNTINPLDIGISQLYNSYLFREKQEFVSALKCVQEAIILFSHDFRSKNIYDNPSSFTGNFAYFRMFDALKNKASLFYQLYSKNREPQYLKASLKTYLLTLEFLNYIERNYDTDDAKLLLKKNSREVYEEAIDICMQLDQLEPGNGYSKQAFYIAELNKGSIVASNVHELAIGKAQYETNAISQRIRNLKFSIARLNLRIDVSQLKDETATLVLERNNYEMELSRASKLLEENNIYYKAKYSNLSASVPEIQSLISKRQALISYYIAKGKVYIFVLTRNSFDCLATAAADQLEANIDSWLRGLKTIESGRKFRYGESGSAIYKQLVEKVQAKVPNLPEWIIIPDGSICQLPFESLPIGENPTGMLELVAISYEFSARSMVQRMMAAPSREYTTGYQVLSFAPFTMEASAPGPNEWNALPASLKEIEGLNGLQYSGNNATRVNFLNHINKFPVVHLATHAYADVSDPTRSFVAFYPKGKDSLESRLYLEELYGLKLDSTQLVIISACETGEGVVASNEGVLSLSRGFAYAGSAASINSLWKADDNATAYILAKLHFYLQKGYLKPVALQQAKLDYIHSNELGKTPNYWSNLIIIGDPSPLCAGPSKYFWLMVVVGIYILLVLVAIIRNMRKREAGKQSIRS